MSNGFLALDIVKFKPYVDIEGNGPPNTMITAMSRLTELVELDYHYMDQFDYDDLTHEDWVEKNYDQYETELDLVEAWANEKGLIDSVEMASEQFRQEWIESDELAWLKMSDNDKQTHFSDWVDSMTKNNLLHQEQYRSYEYNGDDD